MQVPRVPSRGKGRLSLPPHKSVLADRLCVLLAKDRTIHTREVLLIPYEIISRAILYIKYNTFLK